MFFRTNFVLLAISSLLGNAFAADITWDGSSSRAWNVTANWDLSRLPTSSDRALVQITPGPIIDSGVSGTVNTIQIGGASGATLDINGGTLTTSGSNARIDIGYAAATNGTLTINSGTVNCAQYMYVGYSGTGTVNMNGGTLNISGARFRIGYNSSGIGRIYLYGGTINYTSTSGFSMGSNGTASMDITNGSLILGSDQRTTISGYIASGKITAFGGTGTVLYDYNVTNSGKTTVTAMSRKAKSPVPANNAADIAPDANLSWTPGLGAVSHDIYFGTTSPGTFQNNQTATMFEPGRLALNTVYYWRIDEVNGLSTVTGDIWTFTTTSGLATNPDPASGSTSVPVDKVLHWTPGSNPDSYDVYFGTDANGVGNAARAVGDLDGDRKVDFNDVFILVDYWLDNPDGSVPYAGVNDDNIVDFTDYAKLAGNWAAQADPLFIGSTASTSYDPCNLAFNTTYYWRVDEVFGPQRQKGNVWNFTTAVAPPEQAANPGPSNGATGVSISSPLSWTAGSGATSHDVYFGTTSPGTFKVNQTAATYNPGTLAYSTTYYWRIDEKNAGGTTIGVVWSFTTSAPPPPGQAATPNPTNGASGVSTTSDLSWSAGSGATSHDVYFGTASPGTFRGNQTATTFDTGTMANNTTYYWRIDEKNAGGTATGVIWSFTTVVAPPGQAASPNPANGASGVSTTSDLSWSAGSGATSHDVYFGTASPGTFRSNQTATTFDAGTMTNNTTYYWRIDEKNAGGTTTGTVWSFTTVVAPPGQAASPNPANGASGVSTTSDLSWSAGSGATSHDVYFGTASPGTFRGNQTATTFDTGTMANSTTYYWRIDEKNAGGTTTGTVWSFTTVVAPPGQAANPNPANGANAISTTSDLSWSAGSGATSHDVYFGTASPGTFRGNQTATTFDTGTMANSTTYYWRIDEKNAGGTTTGVVWSFTTSAPPPPGQAANPNPSNGATGVATSATLSWTAGSGATSHDVYFGTTSPGAFIGNQTAVTYNPGTLADGTSYYWRIDEKNTSGTTTGVVWSFTTTTVVGVDRNWTNSDGDRLWRTAANWSGGAVPTGADKAAVRGNYTTSGPIIDSSTSAVANQVVVGDWASTNDTLTMNGGTLTTGSWFILGYGSANRGTFTISDGTVNINDSFYVGFSGTGTLNMTGGTITVAQTFGVAQQAGSTADASLEGGTISCNALNMTSGGTLDISAGALIINGDATATVDTYENNGWLTAYDGAGTLNVDYNVTNPGKTTVTASQSSLPGQAANPNPANGATGVSTTNDLSWTAGSGATSHDVYFGTASNPPFIRNQTAATYDTGTMANNTTYYWRINEKNASGTTTGDVWSFTTAAGPQPPGQAASPNPANGTSGVSITSDLSWSAGSGATSHDVYFGTTSPGTFKGNQTATTYDTGTMANNTTYYWRIDEKNANGTTTGIVWNFTTIAADSNYSLVGKIMCGYQGWFACPGDGSNRNWVHWSTSSSSFNYTNLKIEMWPDTSEYDRKYEATGFTLGTPPYYVFSSYDANTTMVHFKWMRDYGIDGVFVQRFGTDLGAVNFLNTVLTHCKTAANAYGRKYAVMYDLTGYTTSQLVNNIETDWQNLENNLGITTDPQDDAYIKHNGKPVIAIYGIFGTGVSNYPDPARCATLIQWFKDRGFTVLIGVNNDWRTRCDTDTNFQLCVSEADIIMPWNVGRYGNTTEVISKADGLWTDDLNWCNANGKEYLVCVFPGFSWSNWNGGNFDAIPRMGGQFLWDQYYNAQRIGATMIYQAMFDEVDEGTAIFKVSNDPPPPSNGKEFLTLQGLPSDEYLWLVGQGTRMLRSEIPLSSARPSR